MLFKLIFLFSTIISAYYCVSQSNLPSKHPWNPLPVSNNRLTNSNKPSSSSSGSSSLTSAASITSSTVYLPEKKSSETSFETHDKTYSIESTHFPTPIIEHHPNGATVGLDLPEANIRLLLDIDQLGGKPVAQHIGLKVVEKNKKQLNGQLVKSEPVKVNSLNHQHNQQPQQQQQQHNRHQPINNQNHNGFGSSVSSSINHQTTLKSSPSALPISPQLTTIGRTSKIVQIPVSTNYKIGYIRTNDLHSAIHHQIVHGKGGNQVSVLSAPNNYAINQQSQQQINSQHQRFSPKQLDSANQGRFISPRLESGSFKPIENYSNQMKQFKGQFEGQIKINNSLASSVKKSSIQSINKINFASPVNVIKGKLPTTINNNLKETEQIKESFQQQKQQTQFNDEQTNSNDFTESDLQSKLESPPASSTISNSRNQRSPKKLDKLVNEVNESTATWNSDTNSGSSSSSADNSNDIVNADQGFDDDNEDIEDVNNSNENESAVDDNNRIKNHKTESKKSNFDDEPATGKLTLASSSSANGQCDLRFSRCPMSCQTITEQLVPSDSSLTLESITLTLGADLLLNAIPSSQTIIQSLIDSSTSGYTLFLPSNEALAKLPGTLINRWKSDPSGLNSLLANHFIDNQVTLENLKSMTGISLKSGSNQLQFGIFRNETYTVNGQQISIGNQRSPNNGIIHIIEGILYPSADKDIMATLKSCNKFDGFVTLAMGTGLASTLSRGGPYTVFVPSNEALQKIPEKDLQLVRSNMTALKDMLTYHVVPGLYYSNHLMDGQFINSLQSSLPIKVGVRVDRCSRRLVEVNMSPVYGVDIPASNGVIHVIDWIIKPNDNDWCDDVIFPR